MWRGIGALLLMLLLLSSNVCAQTDTLLYPLKNVPLLSGNFGELRATHLHTGLDFKLIYAKIINKHFKFIYDEKQINLLDFRTTCNCSKFLLQR